MWFEYKTCAFQCKRLTTRVLVMILFFFLQDAMSMADTPTYYRIRKVVIDAGHGGEDPGALGKNSREKDIVLGVALRLGKYIEDNFPDIEVIYTRKEDIFIPLHERADIANRNKADLFISIHANANPNNAAFGTETYVMGLYTDEKNMEVARKENSVIVREKDYTTHYEGFDPNSAESYIIFSLMQNAYIDQSLTLAAFTEEQFRTNAKRTDRGVKQAGFLVLWRTSMPSILIETGFLTNSSEEKYLLSEDGQDYLANSIYKAFSDYKKTIERKSGIITATPGKDTTPVPVISPTPEITFKVQITATRNRIAMDSEYFQKLIKKVPQVVIDEYSINGIYKYTTGNFHTYQEILDLSQQVKQVYPDAFITAMQNGKFISLNEALKNIQIK
jgi:N-acetylmuramoyl-L-alanine amidase